MPKKQIKWLYLDVGLVFIMIGVFLMCTDYYFRWPPEWSIILNDDVVGFTFLVLGFAYIYWALSKRINIRFEHLILTLGAGLMGGLAAFQFAHELFIGLHYSWISNAGILGVLIYMGLKSQSKKDGGGDK